MSGQGGMKQDGGTGEDREGCKSWPGGVRRVALGEFMVIFERLG